MWPVSSKSGHNHFLIYHKSVDGLALCCVRLHKETMSSFDQDPRPDVGRFSRLGHTRVGKGARLVGRQTLAVIGLLLVILSVPVGFLTPFLPIGLPIGLLGSALLARNSVWGQRFIGYLLRRHPKLEKITPDWLLKLILGQEKTD